MTHRLHRFFLLVFLSAFGAGCKTDMGASYVELLHVVEPDATCVFATSGQPSSVALYDPTINEGAGYKITYVVKNNLAKAADDLVPLGELTNLHGVANDAQIVAFEGCWYVDDGAAYNPKKEASGIVDCAGLPSQSGFFFAPQTPLEGLDQQVASVNVLTLEDMRNLFGTNFTPWLIPIEGNVPSFNPGSNDPNLQYTISQNTQSPADTTTRSPYWGQFYPAQREVVVNVQLRARVQTQTGTVFHTNWLTYPITVSPGGIKSFCGNLVPKVCLRGPCGNGAACTVQGNCADGTTCSNAVLASGFAPGVGPCLPAQRFAATPPLCNPVGCNATN